MVADQRLFNAPKHVCATRGSLGAVSALPDTSYYPLYVVLAAEYAVVFSVLGDFDLLDHFTEGRTIPGTVFACDTNFASTAALEYETRWWME